MEELDLWEFEPTASPSGDLEERVTYLENLLSDQKLIYINIDGHFKQVDRNIHP